MAINLSQFQQPEHLQEVSNKNLSEGSLKQSSLTVPQQVSKKIHQESSPVQQFQQLVVLEPQQTQATQGQLRKKIQFPTTTQFLCSAIFRLLQNPNQDYNQIQEFKKQLKEYLRIKESLMQIVQTQMRIIKIFVLKPHEIRLDNINALDQSSLRLMLEKLLYTNLDQFTRNHISSLFRQYIQCKSNSLSYQLEQEIVIQLLQNLSIRKMFDFQTITQSIFSENQLEIFGIIQNSALLETYMTQLNQISFTGYNIQEVLNKAFDKIRSSSISMMKMEKNIFSFIDTKGSVIINSIFPIDNIVIYLQIIHAYYLSISTNVLVIPQKIVDDLDNDNEGQVVDQFVQQSHKILIEIFPFSLDENWLTVNRRNYLQELANWNKDYQIFLRELDELDDVDIEILASVQESLKYNPLQKKIQAQIQKLLQVINMDISDKQQDEVIQDLIKEQKTDLNFKGEPILRKHYSTTEYFIVLLKLIKQVIIDQYLFTLREFAFANKDVFRNNFVQFLKCQSPNQRMLLETFYIWAFQENRFYYELGHFIQSALGQQIGQLKLKDEDINQVQKIIHCQGAWQAIDVIKNSYAQEQTNQETEYDQLLQFLRSTKIISFDIVGIKGITLYNGRIGLNKKTVYPYNKNEKQKRSITILTTLNETFGNKKRLEYVHWSNVLQATPEKDEAGRFVEIAIFGNKLVQLSDEQSDYIVNPDNWTSDRSSEIIIKEFKGLPGMIKTEQSNKNESQTLESLNCYFQVGGWCPLQKKAAFDRANKK